MRICILFPLLFPLLFCSGCSDSPKTPAAAAQASPITEPPKPKAVEPEPKRLSNKEHLAAAPQTLKTADTLSALQVASQHLEAVRAVEPKNKQLERLTGVLAKKSTAAFLAQREQAARGDNVRVAAQVRCRSVIEANLKAPSTADFQSGLRDGIRYDGKFMWTVQTRVDAQNSFGAKLRSVFTCKVRCLNDESCQVVKVVEN